MRPMIERTVREHRRALDAGEYSSLELTRAFLARIEEVDPMVGAFLTVDAEGALRAARESDARIASGTSRGILEGIPYAIKDNFCTKGIRTSCASRMLENFVPPYDATVVEKLRDAGAVLLGKLNLDEFAMGSSGEHSAFGVTRNPYDSRYVAGGSSGGAAAAVAANEAVFAIGSDTGGSVRQPAAFCGTVGLKPTYGRISRYGMIALASSLDCVGLLTRSAEDAALLLELLEGEDGRDATGRTFQEMGKPMSDSRLRVAVIPALAKGDAVSLEITAAVERAIAVLQRHGAEVGEIELPAPEQALAAYCVLSAAEAASNMARFDGVRYGKRSEDFDGLISVYANTRGEFLGEEVKRRILFGTYMLSKRNRARYYDSALEMRETIRERLKETFAQYDMILSPTAPTEAFLVGAEESPAQRRRADLCAVYASLAGLPAISVPFGTSRAGLPLAVQLTAAPFAETKLLRVARVLEKDASD